MARGTIIAIGGAEDKLRNLGILRRFVELCSPGTILIVPTASALKDGGENYHKLFRELGASDVMILPIRKRRDATRPEILKALCDASGLFFTGGDQKRLQRHIGTTMLSELIRQRNIDGMHVAGTSAGAAFMSAQMIAGGKSGSFPRPDMVQMQSGLGLLKTVIVDQHFRQRNRLGRLLAALAEHGDLQGIGIDEDTAVFIQPDDTFAVHGSGSVTVLDTADVRLSHPPAGSDSVISMADIRVHILARGSTYDLVNRVARLDNQ